MLLHMRSDSGDAEVATCGDAPLAGSRLETRRRDRINENGLEQSPAWARASSRRHYVIACSHGAFGMALPRRGPDNHLGTPGGDYGASQRLARSLPTGRHSPQPTPQANGIDILDARVNRWIKAQLAAVAN